MAFSGSYLPVRTPKTIIFSQHRKPHAYVRRNTYNNTIHSSVSTFVQLFSSSSNEWWSPFPASTTLASAANRHSDPMATKSIAHRGLDMLSTWNALAEILRLPFAWGVTAVRSERVSYWREQREQRRNCFFFYSRQRSTRFCRQTADSRRVVGGKKQTMNVGGGVKIETDETKKVHRYAHGDGRMPNCIVNTRDLSTVL